MVLEGRTTPRESIADLGWLLLLLLPPPPLLLLILLLAAAGGTAVDVV